jgi:hypothetical protein
MLERITWGPVWGKKYRAGAALLPQTPLKYFIEHTFLHLLSSKLGFALCWRGEEFTVFKNELVD